eukprot:CAMPEP_0196579908 /NCGR_PEP_ID=MMETSP1081-20130531/25666_1 /TAXON_ID=36882 /ORGANISM="Pyramimonas amylifera, Strain CCMP720" /LENGTH=124 /DNA_ID=CAMNT_0041899625 /DNA_START=188 /DNA_END=562 /DNA_ORIENTATION=-
MDEFLTAMAMNWLTRKAASLFLGGRATLTATSSEDLDTLDWTLDPVPKDGNCPTLTAGGASGPYSAAWDGDVFVVTKEAENSKPRVMFRRFIEEGKVNMLVVPQGDWNKYKDTNSCMRRVFTKT